MASFRPRTFAEYLQALWHKKLLFFSITVAMLISTFFIISGLPNVYESRASVVVAGRQDERQALSTRVAAVTEQLMSRSFLESLIHQRDLHPKSGPIDSAVARLRKDINIDVKWRLEHPETLSITYRNANPLIAKQVATDLVSMLIKVNESIEKQVAEEAMAVSAEISQVEGQLRVLDRGRAAAAARRNAAGRGLSQINEIRVQRIAAASSVETLSDKQYSLEQQIAEQKRQIAEQERIVKLTPSDSRLSASYGGLVTRKAQLEAQLKDYSSQYTEKNPKVIQVRAELAEINRQINELTAGGQDAAISSAEARELRALQRELSRMQTELEVTRRELQRKKQALDGTQAAAAPAAAITSVEPAPADGTTESEYDHMRSRYTALLNKQDSLRMLRPTAAGLQPGLFQIVDMPVEPKVPVGPNRQKFYLIALALSLGVGLVVTAATEIPHLYKVRDERDVEFYLGTPVIALIPETLTPAERGRSWRLAIVRRMGMLLLAAAVSGVIILINYLQNIF